MLFRFLFFLWSYRHNIFLYLGLHLCFYNPKEKIEIYTYGELRGSIGKEEKGSQGFGYDPLFNLKNTKRTMAEISFKERMNISHRTQSTKKMLAELNKLQNN